MSRRVLILLLGALLASFLTQPAAAMPAGEEPGSAEGESSRSDEFYEHVVETRRTARERYRAVREERMKQLNLVAAAGVGDSDHVPGWRSNSQPPHPEPVDEGMGTGTIVVLLIGCGVILSLALRILAPFLYDRKPKALNPGEPLTLTLKPREERRLRRT